MGRRLILETNVLIAYKRQTLDRTTLDDDELAIAAVSVAEYGSASNSPIQQRAQQTAPARSPRSPQ